VIILEGVLCMVDVRIVYQNVLGKGGGRIHLREQCVGVSIILRWILEMWELRLGTSASRCEDSN
jgi:hypothetical protein